MWGRQVPLSLWKLIGRNTCQLRKLSSLHNQHQLSKIVVSASSKEKDALTQGVNNKFVNNHTLVNEGSSEAGAKNVASTESDRKENIDGLKQRSYVSTLRSAEEHLFDMLCDNGGRIPINRFLMALYATGLRPSDPRLAEVMRNFSNVQHSFALTDNSDPLLLDIETFKQCVMDNIQLIGRAFRNQFVIPEFQEFAGVIDSIYHKCLANTEGKIADYIPQLSRFDPGLWGVSVCTIDGQRVSYGDTDRNFCLQSCSKPLMYALALNELGPDIVHQYVGQEPSGRPFNEISLNSKDKPHNPLVNSGAVVITSLLKNDLSLPDRFDYVQTQFKRIAGGEFLGFSNATFLSERQTANRNFSLGYYMKEKKVFPASTNLMETLDFYFQLCSIEANCESASVMAATLANGGICPITGEKILNPQSVRNTLSLMHSCGMYDYSGQFAFKVGLPGKSGVSGAILLVVPNVMGICVWSPPLDTMGNSCRGIQFCDELVQQFNFHNYDNLKHSDKKDDPRKRKTELQAQKIVNLIFSACNGDITALRRFALAGYDMEQSDYDGRTALHLAAAEGHNEVVKFLLERCNVNPQPTDRWGFTPLDDAKRFNHQYVIDTLNHFSMKP